MYCFHCKQELPIERFSLASQRRLYRGKIKFSRCQKCNRASKKLAISTTEKRLERAVSPKKKVKLQRKLNNMVYRVIVKPRMNAAKRRAKLLQARPTWVSIRWFEPVYSLCAQLTKETGIQHHVDHIVPLQSSKVCGLDVPWNLQVLTRAENSRKSNKFIPGVMDGLWSIGQTL